MDIIENGAMRVNQMALRQATIQKRQEDYKNNPYIHENDYIRSIRHDYPLEIEIREFSQEEFENLRNLSHHIREHFFFKYYQVMDEAIAHHLGGLEWHDDQWMIEAILYNLNRLLSEKGPEPTDDDLKDYIESHSLDLKWHPGAVEQAFLNMGKQIQEG